MNLSIFQFSFEILVEINKAHCYRPFSNFYIRGLIKGLSTSKAYLQYFNYRNVLYIEKFLGSIFRFFHLQIRELIKGSIIDQDIVSTFSIEMHYYIVHRCSRQCDEYFKAFSKFHTYKLGIKRIGGKMPSLLFPTLLICYRVMFPGFKKCCFVSLCQRCKNRKNAHFGPFLHYKQLLKQKFKNIPRTSFLHS